MMAAARPTPHAPEASSSSGSESPPPPISKTQEKQSPRRSLMIGAQRASPEEAAVFALLSDLARLDSGDLLAAVDACRAQLKEQGHTHKKTGADKHLVAKSVSWAARAFYEETSATKKAQHSNHFVRTNIIDSLRKRLLEEEPDHGLPTVEEEEEEEEEAPSNWMLEPTTVIELEEEENALLRTLNSGSNVLVKTIRNDHWLDLCGKLERQSRSPCSLPPPGCVGMRLFGRVWAQSCGLVMSRELALDDAAWCWPSGFFAKTEFGLSHETEEVRLSPELKGALVTIQRLEEMARKGEYSHFGELKTANIVPYNEVYCSLKPQAVIAVFARSSELGHLIFAMKARDAIQAQTRREIALLVIDAGGGDAPKFFSHDAQGELLRSIARQTALATDGDDATTAATAAAPMSASLQQVQPHNQQSSHHHHEKHQLGLNLKNFDLRPDEALRVHGACLATRESLAEILLADEANRAESAEIAMEAALFYRNAAAAKAIVRCLGPMVLRRGAKWADGECSLEAALARARPEDEECLGATGALSCFFSLSVIRSRAREAAGLLDEWLKHADSFAFRMKSYRDASQHIAEASAVTAGDSGSVARPRLLAFAGRKCVTNRANFRDALLKLSQCPDNTEDTTEDTEEGASTKRLLSEVLALVVSCHAPSLRLELLQFVLGLDARWSRDLLLAAVEFALYSMTN